MRRLALDLRLREELKRAQLLHTNPQPENQSCSNSLAAARSHGMLSLGCPIINKLFNGGLPVRGITEVAGESSSGKTQICLQLAMMARTQAEESELNGVLFVCTEDPFPIKRLRQLIESNVQFKSRAKKIMDGIFIEHIESIDGLQTCLERKLPILARRQNVKLLIIDSIAAPFRCHFGCFEAAQRAQKLYSIGSILHKLNEEFQMAIVCVNQVTDVVNDDNSAKSSNRLCAPSLGLVWSNIINTRIVISRTSSVFDKKESSESSSIIIRRLDIIFSPSLPPSCCYFVINSFGVRALKENESSYL